MRAFILLASHHPIALKTAHTQTYMPMIRFILFRFMDMILIEWHGNGMHPTSYTVRVTIYDVNMNVAQFYLQIPSILQCCAFLKYSTFYVGALDRCVFVCVMVCHHIYQLLTTITGFHC